MAEDGAAQPGMHPSFINTLRQKERVKKALAGIRSKIGVYSAKGGVGKTTVAVNLAYTLHRMGHSVGLLDADIDCPNVCMFLGTDAKMDIRQFPLKPIDINGVKVASTAMVVDDAKKPIIWRGALIAKMLGDFFENTDWGELDYLIIDLPPGTSDAPLSIMQLLDMKGFVLVTTPQRIASVNSVRSGLMAKRLGIAVLGVVENMSGGKPAPSTENAAEMVSAPILGAVKADQRLSDMPDSGRVPVLEDEALYGEFKAIAERIE
ncbi:MAG: Mrp/NBP35 family ATP-binding protein [Candidatus Marsarchaeota archaeon]|jgi:ATP-binding protein involved in chromosome partitioning|nr:Mrp/NBP35 family ATP-binding protein [Candidatus Marsarchaeota archaeon]